MEIFNYLPRLEWRVARAVCKRWLETLSDITFCKRLPLAIENCMIQPSAEPLSVFLNTPKTRAFPYVEVKKVHYTDENAVNFKNMFTKIGRYTSDLRVASKMDEKFLTYFPRLKYLHLKNIDRIMLYKPVPKSLESIHIRVMNKTLSKALIKRLKKNLKTLTADWIWINENGCVALSKKFRELATANDAWLRGPFSTNKNLLEPEDPVDIVDVTKIKIGGHIEEYTVLKEFTNLKVSHLRY